MKYDPVSEEWVARHDEAFLAEKTARAERGIAMRSLGVAKALYEEKTKAWVVAYSALKRIREEKRA